MKKLCLFIIAAFILPQAIIAQQGWFWQNPLPQVNFLFDIYVFNPNTAIAVGLDGTVIKTTNGGTSWSSKTIGTTVWLQSIHFTDDNTGWIAGGDTILNTTDGGENWNSQSSGTTNILISVYFTDNTKGWAVGTYGTILNTTDGGENWNTQSSGTMEWLQSVHFKDNNMGWTIGRGGTILKTIDGGENWNSQTSGTTHWLSSVYFTDNNIGWAVGWGGTILNTTDGGENWKSQTSGTTNELESVYFTDNTTGWAVGWYGTILKTTNGGVTFIEEIDDKEVPEQFLLSQNYPNPFNPSTTIKFSLPSSGYATLKIYNALGEEIVVLLDNEFTAGTYEVEWNASRLPSGIYFYQLKTEGFVETKKMILLK